MKTIPDLNGEYVIRVMDLPSCSRGFVIYDDDDFANIYINAHLSHGAQVATADHEIKHILNDDIHNSDDIRTVEARADGLDPRLKGVPNLMRARDLLSKSPPPPRKETPRPVTNEDSRSPASLLSPHQARVLAGCLSELDRWLFAPDYDY